MTKKSISLPNGSDSIPLEDLYSNLKDNKVEIELITLMAITSDLHYLQGYVESLRWGMEFWRDKAVNKEGTKLNPNENV